MLYLPIIVVVTLTVSVNKPRKISQVFLDFFGEKRVRSFCCLMWQPCPLIEGFRPARIEKKAAAEKTFVLTKY